MSLDAARLAEIQERLDKAAPGPWWTSDSRDTDSDGYQMVCGTDGDAVAMADDWVLGFMGEGNERGYAEGNAALIANAPTDLADLLAAHEALTAQVDLARNERDEAERYVAVLRHALLGVHPEHRSRGEIIDALLNAERAAEAFKRQQRLEGAREFAKRCLSAYRFLGRPTVTGVLADMEREAKP